MCEDLCHQKLAVLNLLLVHAVEHGAHLYLVVMHAIERKHQGIGITVQKVLFKRAQKL